MLDDIIAMEIRQVAPGMNDLYAEPRTQAEIKNLAEQASDGVPGSKVDLYYDMSIKHTADGQNVHDRSVGAHARGVMQRIKDDQNARNGRMPDINDIKMHIKYHGGEYAEGREGLIRRAEKTLDNVTDLYAQTVGMLESEVLRRIWSRADDPRNADNKKSMRQSMFDALVDCHDDRGNIVCINGRVCRYISALSFLDWDKNNWELKKTEDYRNEIFEKLKDVVKDLAFDIHNQNSDPEIRKAAMTYVVNSMDEMNALGSIDYDKAYEVEGMLRQAVSAHIDDMINEINTDNPDAILPGVASSIKEDALAAI
jgi:hypothetical protein